MYCGDHCVANWTWHVEPGQHPGYTLWGCWGGNGELKIGEQRYPLSAGDIFLLDYQESVSGRQGNQWLDVKYVDFSVLPEQIACGHKVMKSTKFMGELFARLKNSMNETGSDAALWFRAILSEYNSCDEGDTEEGEPAKSIAALHDLLLEHPELPVSVTEYAKEIHYSTDHVIREFKKKYGVSPYQERQRLRFDKACSFLLHSSFSITDISELCGFDTPNSFSKFFREYWGDSPSEFRKKNKRAEL